MTKVLITGATGNVGLEVIRSLQELDHQLDLYAGVRDLKTDKIKLAEFKINFLKFDFVDSKSHDQALTGCDILFLLRPPLISDVEKYFVPIINSCKDKGVAHIVFISVQGVEKSNVIPHHKIEKLIIGSKISYTFLRPAYFMQNFTTTLSNDLLNKKKIVLPAGEAKFTLIDVRDIGAVSASILTNVTKHINKSYELTSDDKLTFSEMAATLTTYLGFKIKYQSPNLIKFFITKRREKVSTMFILVMIMLHYFPRFQKEPRCTDCVEKLIGRRPITFKQFVNDNKRLLMQ